MTLENVGAFFRHCPQIRACSDANGTAQILHDGPVYLCMPDQHDLQKGE
jgi:hypothetical protein